MKNVIKGALVATAVAGLASTLVACGTPTDTNTKKVKCEGINECKGQGKCSGKTKDGKEYTCAGNNQCKGQGWIEVTEKECTDKKGTVKK